MTVRSILGSESVAARQTDGSLNSRYYRGAYIVEDGEISADNALTSVHSSELYTNKSLGYLAEMTATEEPWFLYLAYQVFTCTPEVQNKLYAHK